MVSALFHFRKFQFRGGPFKTWWWGGGGGGGRIAYQNIKTVYAYLQVTLVNKTLYFSSRSAGISFSKVAMSHSTLRLCLSNTRLHGSHSFKKSVNINSTSDSECVMLFTNYRHLHF